MTSHIGCLLIIAAFCPMGSFPAALRHTRSGGIVIDFEKGLYPFTPDEWNGTVAWKVVSYESLGREMSERAPRPIGGGGERLAKLDIGVGISFGSFMRIPWFIAASGATISFDYYLKSSLEETCWVEVAYLEKGAEYQTILMSLYKSTAGDKEFFNTTAAVPAGIHKPIQVWIYGSGKGADIVGIDNFIIEGDIKFIDSKLNEEGNSKIGKTIEPDFTTEIYQEKTTGQSVTEKEEWETTPEQRSNFTEEDVTKNAKSEEVTEAVPYSGAKIEESTREETAKTVTEVTDEKNIGKWVTETTPEQWTGFTEEDGTTEEISEPTTEKAIYIGKEVEESTKEETTEAETKGSRKNATGELVIQLNDQLNATADNLTSVEPGNDEESDSEGNDRHRSKVSVYTIAIIVYPNGEEEVSVSHDHFQKHRYSHEKEDVESVLNTLARIQRKQRDKDNLQLFY